MRYIIYPDIMLLWVFLINYLTNYMTCRIALRAIGRLKILCWSAFTSIILVGCYITVIGNNIHAINALYIALNLILEIIFITKILKLNNIHGIAQILAYNSFSLIMLAGIMGLFNTNKPFIKSIFPIATIICFIIPWIRCIYLSGDKTLIYPVKLQLNNHIISANGYMDTGNNLRDIYTGFPVIIINHNLLKNVISQSDYEQVEKYILTKDYTHISSIVIDNQRIYPIHYQTISSSTVIMPCFKLKRLIYNNHIYENVVAGISTDEFGKDLDYDVLLNNNL